MTRLAACAFLFCTGLCSATDPDPAKLRPTAEQVAKAEALARKLGSNVFYERDQATRELAEMGRLALGVVERTLAETANAEVRDRCETLRPAMQQEELKARMEAFIADADGKYDHKLPAWDKFQKVVGNTAETRKLYTEMFEHTATARVLTASQGTKEEFARAAVERRGDIYNRMYGRQRFIAANGVHVVDRQPPSPAEVAGVLFTEGLLGTVADRRTSYSLNAMVLQSPTGELIKDAAKGVPYRKLVAFWCDSRTDTYEEYAAMSLAAALNHKDIPASKYALKVIDEKGAVPVQQAYAISVLAKCGGKDQLPNIVKQFDNKATFTTFFANNNGVAERADMQARDVALAMALLVSDQKPEDFGFTTRNNLNDVTKWSYTSYRLASDEKRTEAFKKWDEFQKKK